ncbi:signaling threshold-regulating transmembrane adapter 1-like [Notolabrus celidotus]|uniref:signaling threshold-regulating transmembrane adapter 1-like n=1 Tax=Notolabrus celidotus TaxID=1203425 RepID=UPI00148F74AC|nr:signaling threshold-regulating transmembrane adapter 1-like [Notolabrus celidotus]
MADCCNGTKYDLGFYCLLPHPLSWVLGITLLVSLCLNCFCCVSKYFSGKWSCQPRKRQSRGSRQMEENPIYGNLGYMQTSTAVFNNIDPLQRVNSDSQSKSQDCYANLNLKPPRLQSGCSSSQIEFSDEVLLEEPLESEKGVEPCTDAVSTLSDLYASVQTQRTKTVHTADSREEYANHL